MMETQLWFLSLLFLYPTTASCFTLFPRLQCLYFAIFELPILEELNPNLLSELLREDSVFSFAPAGDYFGPDGIVEYMSASTTVSPWYKSGPNITAVQLNPIQFDQDTDTCLLSANFVLAYEVEPSIVGSDYAYNTSIAFKFYIDIKERYITRINAHFPAGYLRFITESRTGSGVIDLICNVMENDCVEIYGEDVFDATNCRERYTALPNSTGPQYYIDGDSKGCRTLHGQFAIINPQGHCAHLSFEPLADPNGEIKCQESQNRQVLELFTQDELDRFERFQIRNGIDPEIGHDLDTCAELNLWCSE